MEFVFNYTYPEYAGRCHACIFASNISVYVRQSPVCLFDYEGQTYNIAEDIERYTCFNDDPRAYEDIECKTQVSNDTFECYRGCIGTPDISEGQTIRLGADRRCIYKINFWNKDDLTVKKLLFEDQGQERPVLDDEEFNAS